MGRDEGKMTSNDVPVLWLNQPINSDWVRVCILGVCLDLTETFTTNIPSSRLTAPGSPRMQPGWNGGMLERWNGGKSP